MDLSDEEVVDFDNMPYMLKEQYDMISKNIKPGKKNKSSLAKAVQVALQYSLLFWNFNICCIA